VHCNTAFGELVVNFPESQIKDSIDTLMFTLMDILRDVPLIDFDECLSWHSASYTCHEYFVFDPNFSL
jgi:phosphatidylinositol 4-kinase